MYRVFVMDFVVGNGQTVSFCYDRWFYECDFYSTYVHLYTIVKDPLILVGQAFHTGHLKLQFRRQLLGIYLLEWTQLHISLCNFANTLFALDTIIWRWHSSGIFSIKSFYN